MGMEQLDVRFQLKLNTTYTVLYFPQSTSMDLADSYVTFVRQNQEIISEKGLSDELQQRIFTVRIQVALLSLVLHT